MSNGSFPRSGRMMVALTLLASALVLGGCSNIRESLGSIRTAPDEFNVVTRAPLRLPPDLEDLPEPQPGLARPQELQPSEQAQVALFGSPLAQGNPSTGEELLTAQATTNALAQSEQLVIDPNIRGVVDDEHLYILNDSTWIEDINPVTDRGDPTEVLIDVNKERERLQNNAALGLPANAGEFEGVIVVEEEKALLEDLF
jgi:hypothetical protein